MSLSIGVGVYYMRWMYSVLSVVLRSAGDSMSHLMHKSIAFDPCIGGAEGSSVVNLASDDNYDNPFLHQLRRRKKKTIGDGHCHARAIAAVTGMGVNDLKEGIKQILLNRKKDLERLYYSTEESVSYDEFVEEYSKLLPRDSEAAQSPIRPRKYWGRTICSLAASIYLKREIFVISELRNSAGKFIPHVHIFSDKSPRTKDGNYDGSFYGGHDSADDRLKLITPSSYVIYFSGDHYSATETISAGDENRNNGNMLRNNLDLNGGRNHKRHVRPLGGTDTDEASPSKKKQKFLISDKDRKVGEKRLQKEMNDTRQGNVFTTLMSSNQSRTFIKTLTEGANAVFAGAKAITSAAAATLLKLPTTTVASLDYFSDNSQESCRDSEPNLSDASDDELGAKDVKDEAPKSEGKSVLETPLNKYLQNKYEQIKSAYSSKDNNSCPLLKDLKEGRIKFDPPSPVSHLSNLLSKGHEPSPDVFYYPTIWIWLQEIQNPLIGMPKCPTCHSSKDVSSKGWPKRPRMIYGVNEVQYLYYKCYQCNNNSCKNKNGNAMIFNGIDKNVLSQLPLEVVESFPAYMTHKAGASVELMQWLQPLLDGGIGPTGFSNILRSFYTSNMHNKARLYFSTLLSYKNDDRGINGFHKFKLNAMSVEDRVKFQSLFRMDFKDKLGFASKFPSKGYIKNLLIQQVQNMQKYFDFEVKRRHGKVLKLDHSFKVTKHIKNSAYTALATGQNEYSEIRMCAWTHDTSHAQLCYPIKEMIKTRAQMEQGDIELLYADNCCQCRDSMQTIIPSLETTSEGQTQVPIDFNDIFCDDLQKSNTFLAPIVEHVNDLHATDKFVLGFDLETENVCIDVGATPKLYKKMVRLIQLGMVIENRHHIFIIRVKTGVEYDKSTLLALVTLLSHEKVYLVNRAIELRDLCKEKKWLDPTDKQSSLSHLSSIVLGYAVDKSLRQSDWTSETLTRSQQLYAARDAIIPVLIYNKVTTAKCEPLAVVPPRPVHQKVLLDVFHAMKRVTDSIPTRHPHKKLFCNILAQAFFIFNEEDKANVIAHLLKLATEGGFNAAIHLDVEAIFYKKFFDSPSWILRRVRRLIASPEVLEASLLAVLEEFSQDDRYKDKDDKVLLTPAAKKHFTILIRDHVRKGCISDPPDLSLYYENGFDRDGLQLYRCIRGTNHVESFHQFLEMRFQPWQAGPEYADVALTVLRHRYNIRASIKYRPNFPNFGHYEHNILFDIQKITAEFSSTQALGSLWPLLEDYKMLTTGEQFGINPCVETPGAREIFTDEVAVKISSSKSISKDMKYYILKQRSAVPYLPILTVEEMTLYKHCLPQFTKSNKSGYDYQAFAVAWSSGQLKMPSLIQGSSSNKFVRMKKYWEAPIGPKLEAGIHKKLPGHIVSHHAAYSRSQFRLLKHMETAANIAKLKLNLKEISDKFLADEDTGEVEQDKIDLVGYTSSDHDTAASDSDNFSDKEEQLNNSDNKQSPKTPRSKFRPVATAVGLTPRRLDLTSAERQRNKAMTSNLHVQPNAILNMPQPVINNGYVQETPHLQSGIRKKQTCRVAGCTAPATCPGARNRVRCPKHPDYAPKSTTIKSSFNNINNGNVITNSSGSMDLASILSLNSGVNFAGPMHNIIYQQHQLLYQNQFLQQRLHNNFIHNHNLNSVFNTSSTLPIGDSTRPRHNAFAVYAKSDLPS